MMLLTKELEAQFAKTGRQEDKPDPVVIAKFFHCLSSCTWYATEYDPETRIFFGYVVGFEAEFGSFSLTEMEQTKVRGLGIERDMYFDSGPLSVVLKRENHEPHM